MTIKNLEDAVDILQNDELAEFLDERPDIAAQVPEVKDLDAKILEIVERQSERFDMSFWHLTSEEGLTGGRTVYLAISKGAFDAAVALGDSCGTRHCRAGWAVHFAGKEGYALEKRLGPAAAGALIYARSTGSVPDFYADNEEAIDDMRERVGKVSP